MREQLKQNRRSTITTLKLVSDSPWPPAAAALPHALDDRGQPDEELIAMEQRFAQENNATTRSGISRNMMTKEVYERLDLDSRELMARVGYLEVKEIVLRSSDQLHGVEDLAKL